MQVSAIATAAAPMVACFGPDSPWRFLTTGEASTLKAMCERIVPTDQDPGAAWAGAVVYIDRQLCGAFRRFRKTYQQGLASTDTTSVAKFGTPFAALLTEQQDALLESMSKGEVPAGLWPQVSAQAFFDLVVGHTKQGFYGDPRHGGNRDRISWKMLRLPYPPVRGRLT